MVTVGGEYATDVGASVTGGAVDAGFAVGGGVEAGACVETGVAVGVGVVKPVGARVMGGAVVTGGVAGSTVAVGVVPAGTLVAHALSPITAAPAVPSRSAVLTAAVIRCRRDPPTAVS